MLHECRTTFLHLGRNITKGVLMNPPLSKGRNFKISKTCASVPISILKSAFSKSCVLCHSAEKEKSISTKDECRVGIKDSNISFKNNRTPPTGVSKDLPSCQAGRWLIDLDENIDCEDAI